MKKTVILEIIIVSMFFFLFSSSFLLARNMKQDNLESKIKEELNLNVDILGLDNLSESTKNNKSDNLLGSLEKNGVNGGRVEIVKKDRVPKGMKLLAFESDEDAARYIAYKDDKIIEESLAYSTSLYTYTRNYRVHVEQAGFSSIQINARGTYYTDIYGYSRFTYVGKPWITHTGITLGLVVSLNNSWSSISYSKTSAKIGASYHTDYYLIINGLIKIYSYDTTTNKTISPLM